MKALLVFVVAVSLAGCGGRLLREVENLPPPAKPSVVDRAIEDRILAMDPEKVSQADVRNVLVKGPTGAARCPCCRTTR